MIRNAWTIPVFALVSVAPVLRAEPPKFLPPSGEEAKYITHIQQLTFDEMGFAKAGEAYFSPDGGTIAFQATPKGKDRYQIYVMDLKTREPKMISTGKGACTCAYFHPRKKRILWASSHLDPDPQRKAKDEGAYTWLFDEHMDIFESDWDGSKRVRLTTAPGYDAECAYSPDGSQIVFCSMRDGDQEIYVMGAEGSNQRRLTFGKGYDGGPFFSPDGKVIIYRGDRRDDGKMNLQIRMINPDGSADTAITDNPIFNWCPYWYPSGKCFIFTQADHDAPSRGESINYDLFMMTPEGKNLTRITFEKEFDGLPVFSPDGKRIMWTSKRGPLEEAQVFIADLTLPEVLR